MAPLAGLAVKAAPMALSLAPKILPAIGASAVGKSVMGFFGEDDEPEQPQQPAGAMAGQQQMAQAGQYPQMAQTGASPAGVARDASGMPMAAMGLGAGAGGAMLASNTGQQPYANSAAGMGQVAATPTPVAAPEDQPFAGHDDGFAKSSFKTLLAAGAGAVAGVKLKMDSVDDQGLEGGSKFLELAKGALAGAGSGAATKMSYDAIQGEEGGLKAGLSGGVAGSLASTLKEDGPGMFSSFGTGFGAGALSDYGHDKAEEAGMSKVADALGGAGLGGMLGYTGLGDGQSALMGAGGGAGMSTLLGASAENGGMVEGLKSMVPEKVSDLMPGGNDASTGLGNEPQLG